MGISCCSCPNLPIQSDRLTSKFVDASKAEPWPSFFHPLLLIQYTIRYRTVFALQKRKIDKASLPVALGCDVYTNLERLFIICKKRLKTATKGGFIHIQIIISGSISFYPYFYVFSKRFCRQSLPFFYGNRVLYFSVFF